MNFRGYFFNKKKKKNIKPLLKNNVALHETINGS